MLRHSAIFHPGKTPAYNIKAVEFFKDPLSRQINEGVRINNSISDHGYLINSKAEFRQGEVARLGITSGI